jgi:hypothetical protein
MFVHTSHEQYKCRGPYVSKWGCCSASWHPSLLGHELRAAHYSFFWLLVLNSAISDLQEKIKVESDVDSTLEQVQRFIQQEYKHIPGL